MNPQHPPSPHYPGYQAVDSRNPWKPGVIHRMPWLAVGALFGSLAGLAAAAAILVVSDGKPIAQWRYQPATYLAIATVITNFCLFYVLKEGVNTAFWKKASSSGTVVGDLHRYWSFGTSFQDALLSGRQFNLIALACIFATVAQINSPLLQRASRAVVRTLTSQSTVELQLAQTLPDGYSGYISGRQYAVSLFTAPFSAVVQSFNNNGSIPISSTGCEGVCRTSVQGIGLSLNCSSFTVPFDLNPAVSANGQYDVSSDPAVINGTFVFESRFIWYPQNPGNLSLGVSHKSTDQCSGVLNVQNCTIHPARVTYPVTIDGNASTIALDPHTSVFDDIVQDIIDLPLNSNPRGPSTLGGYWLALSNKFDSTSHLRFVGAVGYELLTTGNSATQYAVVNASMPDNASDVSIGSSCSLTFRDPMADLLAGARDLMFRASVAAGAADASTPVQALAATQRVQRAVFDSNYYYMAGAFAITLLAILLAVALFAGFGTLGRSVSMSPVEIAKAFDARLLRESDSNATIKQLIVGVGGRSVRYGVVVGADDGRGQGGGDIDYHAAQKYPNAYASGVGVGVGDAGLGPGYGRRRLEMADEMMVQEARTGWTFSG